MSNDVLKPSHDTALGRFDCLAAAEQCRSLGLRVGDTIEGRESYPGGWHQARLTLLWMGDDVAVWRVMERNSDNPTWSEPHEGADWDLSCRRWRRVPASAAKEG
jgi:hypothetical protein